jgi:hypothetical protein
MLVTRPDTTSIVEPNKRRWYEDLFRLTNRNISYGHTVDGQDQNIDGKMVNVQDTGLIDTEFIVVHNLSRVPLFYDIKYISKACNVYDSGTSWTTTKIFLKCSVANVHIRIFVH